MKIEKNSKFSKKVLAFSQKYDIMTLSFAGVAEWQTHQTQNLTRATSCGFKSHLLHFCPVELSTGLFCVPWGGKRMKKKQTSFLCAQAQASIVDYIHDHLSLKQTEQFLRHIASCDECREELGIYYTFIIGMEKLDDDEDISMDFAEELNKKIKRSEEKIRRSKRTAVLRRGLLFLLAAGWVFADVQKDKAEEPEESTFELQEYFFAGRFSKLDEYIRLHYNAMIGDRYRYDYGNREK